MSKALRFVLTFAISFAAVAPAYCANQVSWVSTMQNALQLAQQDNKLIFVEVTSPHSCPVCRTLDKVERDPRVVEFLSNQYVNMKVDRNSALGEAMATRFQISCIPSLFIFNAKGDLISKQDGAPSDADSFMQQMNILSSSAVSSIPVLQSQSEEAIWPLHQPPAASRLPMPQYGRAPQLGIAPQYGAAPQYGYAPQIVATSSYGATPQYASPAPYGVAPQYVAPSPAVATQYAAPVAYGAASQYPSTAPYAAPQYGAPSPAVAPQYVASAPYGAAPQYPSTAPYAAPQYGAPSPAVAPQYVASAPYGAAPLPVAPAQNGAAPNSANQPNWIDSALQFLGIH